jgi:hypothetical protein
MRTAVRRVVYLTVCGLLLIIASPASASDLKKILVIHSYHQGFKLTDNEMQELLMKKR